MELTKHCPVTHNQAQGSYHQPFPKIPFDKDENQTSTQYGFVFYVPWRLNILQQFCCQELCSWYVTA